MTPKPEQKEFVLDTLHRMTEMLGFQIVVNESEQEGALVLNIQTEDAGRLIGRKGHYLQSLELVLNRIARKEFNRFPWVELDVDGYQSKRRTRRRGGSSEDTERLEKLAADAAKEVKRWGQTKKIGPFNAGERRVVHMTLRNDEEVETESEEQADRKGLKKVMVRLKEKQTD